MSVAIYPVPQRLIWEKPLYKLTANGTDLPVYHTPIKYNGDDPIQEIYHPNWVAYALLSAERGERVEFCVEEFSYGEPEEAVITPRSLGESAVCRDGKIYFSITAPAQVCLTVNGRKDNMLILYLNPPLEELPPVDEKDPSVHYFGPGEHWLQEMLYLKEGETVYLAPGAFVHGRILSENANHVHIFGYGILTSEGCSGRWAEAQRPMAGVRDIEKRRHLVDLRRGDGVKVQGVCLVDADPWTLRIFACKDVWVDNVKILGQRINSDGIDLCSVQKGLVENCFIRTSDDCLVVKAVRNYGDCCDLLLRNCIIYADRASALEIGHELQGNDIYNIRFENIDILDCVEETYGYHAIDITNVDDGNVYNVVYDNIRVENCVRLLGFRVREGIFSRSDSSKIGTVHDIIVKNVTADVDRAIFFSGRNSDHQVYGVTLENISVCGEMLKSLENVRYNPFVSDIKLMEGHKVLDQLEPYPSACMCEPVDIRAMTNRTLGLCGGIYGICSKHGEEWMSLPTGPVVMEGIPFQKVAQGYHPNGGEGSFTRVVVPASRVRENDPSELSLHFRTPYLFFLHTGVNVLSPIDTVLMRYIITYEDGTSETIAVRNQNDCNSYDTWSLAGWQPIWKSLRFYVMPWKNPYPEKMLAKLELVDGDVPDLGILIALTRVKEAL